MKKIFEVIINTFNDERVKALYITIFIFILLISFITLIIIFPIILGVIAILLLFFGIYIIVLSILN